MDILILGGFLGSGKTTLLLQLARALTGEKPDPNQVVILENEIGQVGIDDGILAGQGYAVKTLFAGCACCTIKGSVELTIRDIRREWSPRYILFEASGMAVPNAIRENIRQMLGLDSRICVVADAKRWPILAKGLGHLVSAQLEGADVVLVNKIDLVSPETAESLCRELKEQTGLDALPVRAREGISQENLRRILGV